MKYYEFVTGDTIEIAPGRTLKRIRAVAEIAALATRLADVAEGLLDALRQIAEWPDGGDRYGQENIKRFAQAAIDAAMQRTSGGGHG